MKTMIRLATLLMLGMGVAGTATADIYVWEDEDGTMHFTNSAAATRNPDARTFVEAPPGRALPAPEPERDEAIGAQEQETETDALAEARNSGQAAARGAAPVQPERSVPEPPAYRRDLGPRPEPVSRDRARYVAETTSPEVEAVTIVEEEEIFTPSRYSPVDRFPRWRRWDDRYADRYPPFRAVHGGWNGWGGPIGAFYSGPSPYRVPQERNPNDRYLPSFRRKRTITYRRELRPGSGPPFSRQLRQWEQAPAPPEPWE